jgi:hypothetical protein
MPAGGLVTASIISGGIAAGRAISGAVRQRKANQALEELQNQPMAQYTVSPELQGAYDQAQQMSQRGFTGGEMTGYQSNLAQANNAQYQQARNMAGSSLAGAIGAAIQSQNIGALNQLATSDAEIRRRNIAQANQLAGDIQQQENLNTGAQRQYRIMQEQAFGQAAQQARQDIWGGLNGIGNAVGMGIMAQGLGNGANATGAAQITPSYNAYGANLTTGTPFVASQNGLQSPYSGYNPYGNTNQALPYLTQPGS